MMTLLIQLYPILMMTLLIENMTFVMEKKYT